MESHWKCLAPPNESPRRGKGVKVCVIDSGCDLGSPLLQEADIAAVRAFYPGAKLQDLCKDPTGHGTACISVICAAAWKPEKDKPPVLQYYGIAPEAQIYVASLGKINDESNIPSYCAEALKWACEMDCKVISISIGWKKHNPEFEKALFHARAEGRVIVVCSSNDGASTEEPIRYPARYGGLIVVGAQKDKGQPSDFSSRGRELDFLAPGERIQVACTCWGKVDELEQGSSFAAPFVSGLAALIIQYLSFYGRSCGAEEVRIVLKEMATSKSSHSVTQGFGVLELSKVFSDFREGHWRSLSTVGDAHGLSWGELRPTNQQMAD